MNLLASQCRGVHVLPQRPFGEGVSTEHSLSLEKEHIHVFSRPLPGLAEAGHPAQAAQCADCRDCLNAAVKSLFVFHKLKQKHLFSISTPCSPQDVMTSESSEYEAMQWGNTFFSWLLHSAALLEEQGTCSSLSYGVLGCMQNCNVAEGGAVLVNRA